MVSDFPTQNSPSRAFDVAARSASSGAEAMLAGKQTVLAGPASHWLSVPGRAGLTMSLALLAFMIALYGRIALKLAHDWYEFPDSSHGMLIPFFVLFLLWDKRAELRQIPQRADWQGMWLVVIGLFVLMVGIFGADLFLSRTSFLLVTAGIVWSLCGWKMLGELKFVLFVALLGIPLPTLILNHITFPLQLLSSNAASRLLPLAGVPVLQEGNIIQLPAMQLEVAEACSGIRSLMSLFTVAVIYGYFIERQTSRRVILALASIPIAVVANSARIFGTGLCVQYWDPEKAMGFFHEFSGWLIFLVSLTCLYIVHRLMALAKPRVAGERT